MMTEGLAEVHPIVAQLTPSEEQMPAVQAEAESVVVTAGAGAGKTRTLVAVTCTCWPTRRCPPGGSRQLRLRGRRRGR